MKQQPLKPVQSRALELSAQQSNFGFLMEMGLGKTRAALEEAQFLIDEKRADAVLVLAPNSFKSGWAAEVIKWGYMFDVHVFESSKRGAAYSWLSARTNAKNAQYKLRGPAMLVINYEALLSGDAMSFVEEFTRRYRCYFAIDESIRLKDPSAKTTKAVLNLAFDKEGPIRRTGALAIQTRRFPVIRVLTGKAMTQGPHDLWTQLILAGAKLPSYKTFMQSYCVMGGFQGKHVVGAQNTEQLRAIVDRHCFLAKKVDWMSKMPAKLYPSPRRYDLGLELHRYYRSMEEQFFVEIDGQEITVAVAIAKYRKLAQIQCGFILDTNTGEALNIVEPFQNPRLSLVREILEEVGGKVVITYWHKHSFTLLRDYLSDVLGYVHVARITGGMSPLEVEAQKQLFNEHAECRVILVQIQAGKYGHTLLGDQSKPSTSCSTMLFFENDYSLDARSQVEDRIHRMGQLMPDCLYVDLCGSEMDSRVITALQRKENVYQAIMGSRPQPKKKSA